MNIFFRHAKPGEELDFITVSATGSWGAVVEGIIDHVNTDKRHVGVVIRNRQIRIGSPNPMVYSVEVAFKNNVRGKAWEDVDEDWHGLPPLLGAGLPC